MRTVPLFVKMFRAGCNHIDIRPGNLFASASAEKLPVAIDFAEVVFYEVPQVNALIKQAAHFARTCALIISGMNYRPWIESILTSAEIGDAASRSHLISRFDDCRVRYMPRSERLSLAF
jgi:hypothetical protein